MLFDSLAQVSEAVAATSSRSAKVSLLASYLQGVDADQMPVVIPMLAGRLRQRRTGLGYVAAHGARDVAPAAAAALTVHQVDAALEQVAALAGAGSAQRRQRAWSDLLGRATGREQRLLRGLVTGEVRKGAGEGVLTDAVAAASGVDPAEVRRAVTVVGSLAEVAAAAAGGRPLSASAVQPGRWLSPMLAGTAPDVTAALERTGPAVVDWKLDGIRVQVHAVAPGQPGTAARTAAAGATLVTLFSRSGDDLTARLADLAAAVAVLGRTCVLDAEAVLLDARGRPLPFQETASRMARRDHGGPAPVLAVFDLLYLDDAPMIDLPLARRRELLAALFSGAPALDGAGRPGAVGIVPGLQCEGGASDAAAAADFAASALAAGHEGVIVKAAGSPWAAGRRGSAWVKVKPVTTLDLVVVAAEWGSGRRTGMLSNLHLAARDPEGRHGPSGGHVMLGKTFKGMTDEMLRWQTEHLQSLAEPAGRSGHVVRVRPELVAEIALDGLQRSSRYPGGMALRFARVLRYRSDKTAAEADTIDTVRTIYEAKRGAG